MARGRRDYEKAVVVVESEGFANPHGRILMYDDFEDTPLKWIGTGTGTHSETRRADSAYNGSFGLQLNVTPVGAPFIDVSTAQRLIPIDITERLLLETFWRPRDVSAVNALEIRLRYYDGARVHDAAIMYDQGAPGWHYLDNAGAWPLMPGAQQTLHDNAWDEATLSIDFATDEYIVSKSNNIEVNMGGITCQNAASAAGARLECWLQATAVMANNAIVDFDDIVIRELEL